jgi:hypothetical protein
MKLFKRIWMGIGYLEGYGHHPGWGMLAVFILVCGLAGVEKGHTAGFLGGMAFGTICFLPFFLAGCYSRAVSYEQDMVKTFDILQKE